MCIIEKTQWTHGSCKILQIFKDVSCEFFRLEEIFKTKNYKPEINGLRGG